MGAPKGNKNAEGHDGSGTGRRSAYQERADAELLHNIFFTDFSKVKIKAKLKTGEYSLKDVLISKGFGGDTRVLLGIFKKLFPDNLNLGFGDDGVRDLSDGELDKNIAELQKLVAGGADGKDVEKGGE